MTDIKELVQREEFEMWAEEHCALPWGYLKIRRTEDGYSSDYDYTSLWAAWKAAGAELEKTNQRIAELESRTFNTIEPFRSFVTDADLAALHRFVECCDDPDASGHDLNREKTRRLEAIGALQRSGRISYLTGFGDLLVSITTDIKWESE